MNIVNIRKQKVVIIKGKASLAQTTSNLWELATGGGMQLLSIRSYHSHHILIHRC